MNACAEEPLEEVASQENEPNSEAAYKSSRFWERLVAFTETYGLHIPAAFLGLGVYRAWTVVVLNSSLFMGWGLAVSAQTLFDIAMFLGFLVVVVFSRRIGSICLRPGFSFLSMVLLSFSTLAAYAAQSAGLSCLGTWTIVILGGAGLSMVVLQWAEVYSALSPSRICLYYAASVAVGQLLSFAFTGFKEAWLPFMTALLPYVSYRCLRACVETYDAVPHFGGVAVSHTFPWKPVLVVALCTLAFCLVDDKGPAMSIPGLSLGTFAGSVCVVLLLWSFRERLDVGLVYGIILPFTSAALLLFSTVDELGSWCGFFARFGYAVSQVFIFTMMGAICFHWGVNPLWLFGIERLVRTAVQLLGRVITSFAVAATLPTAPLVFVSILAVTFLILSERRLDSTWGVELSDVQADPDKTVEVRRHNALIQSCARLAASHGLSQREEEVLICLAQHKTAREIEGVLCVANGTAKAHIRHVYQKLNIHTREELFTMVGCGEEEP